MGTVSASYYNNSWAVELKCPQCGAPVTLEEADRILLCAFCRVRMLILYPGHPCYYLEPYQDRKPDQGLIYVPYWRFRGITYACSQPNQENRFIDTTFLAAEIPFLPVSLGLQARAFKLRLLSSQKQGRFLQPRLPVKEFLTRITEERISPPESEEVPALHRQVFVGETVSLVYAPIFLKEGMVFDGLGDRILGKAGEADFEPFPVHIQDGSWQVQFIPILCPYCGADLQGEKDTQVLLCRNCDRVWEYSKEGLKKLDAGIIDALGGQPPYFIPFWRIRARVSGRSPRGLTKLARLVVPPEEKGATGEKEELYFWLPAFKISPSLFLNLSKAVSFRRPLKVQFLEKVPKGNYYPVTLSWDQAREGLEAVWADLSKNDLSLNLPQLKIEPIDQLLVFIPFHLQGGELVQEEIAVGINRKALHFGRFL